MKKLLCLASLIPLFFSCTSEKGNSAGGKFMTAKVVDKLVPEKYMFSGDTVYKAQERASKDQITKARQLFMQGLDLYANQKKPVESIKAFRESILYYPDQRTYVYLANAYIDAADSTYADSALNVFPEPSSDFM